MSVVTRFAPSPTGELHLGHAYSAGIAWRRAREADGRFLLRIEDIDQSRSRKEFEDAIYEDLAVMQRLYATNNIGLAATFHPFVAPMRARRGVGGMVAGICHADVAAATRGLLRCRLRQMR